MGRGRLEAIEVYQMTFEDDNNQKLEQALQNKLKCLRNKNRKQRNEIEYR